MMQTRTKTFAENLMSAIKIWTFLLVGSLFALNLGSCSGKISGMWPSSSSSACSGNTSFANVTCPAAVIWSTQGAVNLTGAYSVVDAYDSGAGAYGGGNTISAGNVIAASVFSNTGTGTLVSGSISQGAVDNLLMVNPTVALQGVTIVAASGQTIVLTAGDYYFSTIDWTGSLFKLQTTGGRVRVWFDTLNITGSSNIVGNSAPNNLWFLGTCGATANISGANGQMNAIIYNPTGTVNLTGASAQYFGGFIGAVINATGAYSGYHRDQSICGY